MNSAGAALFTPWVLPHLTARTRLVRSATYEGMGDEGGAPREALGGLYRTLAENEVGVIITGFAYVSQRGRAMHPCQCGIDADDKIAPWARVVAEAHRARERSVLLMQIAHTGPQTLPEVTGSTPLAPSVRRSPYFRAKPVAMTEADVQQAIGEFRSAALRAQSAGFDGVQIHAGHGYLVHQFLSPFLNRRKDAWGRDLFAFLRAIVLATREACGEAFPVFVKMSVPDGHPGGVDVPLACRYAEQMAALGVEALEVSYGTMDHPLNIFRGDIPTERALRYNPLFNRTPAWALWIVKRLLVAFVARHHIPFREQYNLEAARAVKRAGRLPVIVVGGIRRLAACEEILAAGDADAVALCRPLICEPDLGSRFRTGAQTQSSCTNCNDCAVMCDHNVSVRCYRPERSPVSPSGA